MKFTKQVVAPDVLQEVLNSPIPYTDAEEEEKTKNLLATLSKDEVDIAAEGSYMYWVAKHTDTPPTEDQKARMATRECRRHLVGVKYEDACVNIKETCKFRKEHRIGLYRACFTEGAEFENEDESQFVEKLRGMIKNDLAKQSVCVRGKDKLGHALLVMRSRTSKDTNDEEFVETLVYIMERAIAATEYISRGKQEKILVVLDFGTFSRALSPPMSGIKQIASILQTKYSERLKNLVIIDPPFWMRTIYGILKPFLDPHTKAKFIVATGNKKKLEVISAHIEPEQAAPWLMPDGKLEEEVDLDRFMKVIPFHCLYDDP